MIVCVFFWYLSLKAFTTALCIVHLYREIDKHILYGIYFIKEEEEDNIKKTCYQSKYAGKKAGDPRQRQSNVLQQLNIVVIIIVFFVDAIFPTNRILLSEGFLTFLLACLPAILLYNKTWWGCGWGEGRVWGSSTFGMRKSMI